MSGNFPNLTPNPATNSFTGRVSHVGSIVPQLVDFVPKNQDGSVFDLTNTMVVTFRLWDGVADPFAKISNGTPEWTADATGLHCVFGVGDTYLLMSGTTPKYSIIGLDSGGHEILIATGTLSFQLIPHTPEQP